MAQYNKLFKWRKYNGSINEDDDNNMYGNCSDNDDTRINNEHNHILDYVIRHPYMDQIDFDLINSIHKANRNYLVTYRINTYNMIHHIVEFYILDDFPYSSMEETLKNSSVTDLYTTHNIYTTNNVHDMLHYIDGEKKIKRSILFKDNIYTFIQVRNNKDTSNWLNIWDILVNKHYFGKTIDKHVVDFFKNNSNISNLMLGQNICLKPIVLYSHINERYHEYIRRTMSIQYCQNKIDSLIKLHKFKVDDNVRTICFIDDREFSNTTDDLMCNHYIINRDTHNTHDTHDTPDTHDTQDRLEWIFKDDSILFSFVK